LVETQLDKTSQSMLDKMTDVSAGLKCKLDKSAQADQFPAYSALMLLIKLCSMSTTIICTTVGGPRRCNAPVYAKYLAVVCMLA